MVRITETRAEDVDQLKEWIAADPWHKDDPKWADPIYMITGNGLLAFCIQDDKGPVAYVKLTEDEQLVRIAMQFAPESEVSKKRVVLGLIKVGIPTMKMFAMGAMYPGLVFESVSPSLIAFGEKQGFKSIGNNDYALMFEDKIDV